MIAVVHAANVEHPLDSGVPEILGQANHSQRGGRARPYTLEIGAGSILRTGSKSPRPYRVTRTVISGQRAASDEVQRPREDESRYPIGLFVQQADHEPVECQFPK
ncbi:hypothetical protein IU450_19385 [Nocardia abscessus]|uniref:hypothetical protein n=1 Tax=Nocardia abscessus TaxID=120957 RepID=UPI001895D886|nr:hypothetical protein [Nocardia abscessus]MBF6338044.1 hypothetical protein [Nocardia abscessus]